MSKLDRAVWILAVGTTALIGATVTGAQSPQQPSPRVRLQASHPAARAAAETGQSTPIDRALIDKYCTSCHNDRAKTAGLALDKIDLAAVPANAQVLEKVAWKLRTGQMPPAGRPRPDKAAVGEFVSAVEGALDRAAAAAPNPGRLPIHRLNRVEYVNVVHDLLALDVDGSALLPADNSGLGFDN